LKCKRKGASGKFTFQGRSRMPRWVTFQVDGRFKN
jgi:hypothetical protein